MNLVQRVQGILLKPKATWPVIDAEPADAASLYKNYVMILALIPAVASFIGLSVVGLGAFGVNFRVPIVAGLANMVVGYVLSLVMVFVLALIIDAMAPTFEGTKSQISALKLSAYASTAAFVGGIFSLLPSLSVHRRSGGAVRHLPALHRPAGADEVPARQGHRVHRGGGGLRHRRRLRHRLGAVAAHAVARARGMGRAWVSWSRRWRSCNSWPPQT
jgi:hypothetical protein